MSGDLLSLLSSRRFDPFQIVREHRDEWKVGIIPAFIGGLNSQLSPELIDDSESPDIINLMLFNQKLRVDTGYKKFASQLNEVPRRVFEHKQADGSATLLAVTNATVYKYNPTYEAWQVVKGASSSTLSANASDTDTSITLVSDAGFTVGAVIGITLDDGTQAIRTVATLPGGNVVTFTPALGGGPGVVATAGNAVVEGAELSGINTQQVVFMPVPSNEWTVFTNGVNVPYRYDASSDDVVTVASLSSGTLAADTVCKTLAVYKNSLILLNLIESAASKPYKLQWCDPGDPTDWSGGNSGNASLVDSRDSIIASKPIGSSLVIYRSNSIVLMDFQGSASGYFRFDTAVYGETVGSQSIGAVSPNAVFALPDQAAIFAADGIYLYRGGQNIQLITAKVHNSVFGASGDLNSQKLTQVFTQFADRTNEVFFFYCSLDAGEFPDKALVLNLETGTFRRRTFSHAIVASGVRTDAPTFPAIDDLVGSIDEQGWLLGSDAAVSGTGTLMLCTEDDKYVMSYDFITPRDDGNLITWVMYTKVFDGVDRTLTTDWLSLEIGAGLVVVQYTIDNGVTWVTLAVINDTNVIPRVFHFNVTSQTIQFRLVGSMGGGVLGRMMLRYKETFIIP